MFGSTRDMFGIVEDLAVDNKGRILLPNYCTAEYGDVLVVLDLGDHIDVFNKVDFPLYMEHFKVTNYTYSSNITAFICKLKKGIDFTVDKQLRLCLGEKLFNKYDFNGKACIEGNGIYISIRTRELHDAYIKSVSVPDIKSIDAKVRRKIKEISKNDKIDEE